MNAPAATNGPLTPAIIEQPRVQLAPLTAGARPKAIVPTDMDQVWRFATIVVKSGMAPKGMEKAEAITVAIMHGLEVGLTPLMALQRIAVINGRPSIWGDAAIGLVRASGLCEYVQEMINGDGDNMVASCRAKRKGEKEPIERTFSVGDAKKAGLWGKQGPWQQYPKRMLQMRCRAFALRDLFADVLGGLYIAEELEGLDDDPPLKDVTPRPAVRGTRTELPPALPTRTAPAQEAEQPAEDSAGEAQPEETPAAPVVKKRDLPPPARAAKPAKADGDDMPAFLKREAPPADQPEAFREWIVAQLDKAKDLDALQILWDDRIQVNAENMFPLDYDEFVKLFATKRTEIENQ